MHDTDVYYDFRSPYAYFAAHRMAGPDFRPTQAIRWRWKPVSIDVLLNLQAGRAPQAEYVDPLAPPKRQHLVADVTRLARYYQAPLRPPKPARQDPTLALSVATLLDEDDTPHENYRMAIFRALWEEQSDIANKDTIASCLGSLPHDLIDRTSTSSVHESLITNSEEAYRRGVFGVPSFVHNEEVFFGADRLDLFIASLDWK